MESFVVLGHAPGLSLAEVAAVLPEATFTAVGTEAAILDGDVTAVFSRLGGAVKVGYLAPGSWPTLEAALDALGPSAFEEFIGAGKLAFGFSVYAAGGRLAPDTGYRIKQRGVAVKRTLKLGRSARFVNRGERALASVSVAHNRLTQGGAEFVFLSTPDGWRRGRTAAVQDFVAFGKRDFGRPARDMSLGMLPPKLARIMVNLAGRPRTVLDPFCGMATVLQEGALLGTEVFGSDVSAPVVANAQKNLEWLDGQEPRVRGRWQLRVGDARDLTRVWENRRFDAVITEPYLGPPVTVRLPRSKLGDIQRKVAGTLIPSIPRVASVLEMGGALVIALPVWRTDSTLAPLEILPAFERAGFTREPLLPEGVRLPLPVGITRRGSLLYERPQQRVLREIFRFRRI
jgi:tRNA G10  N-methylase Trm11